MSIEDEAVRVVAAAEWQQEADGTVQVAEASARTIAAYRAALVSGGVPEKEARRLTRDFAGQHWDKVFGSYECGGHGGEA